MAQQQQPASENPGREGLGFYALMFFGFGVAAGVLVAFSGFGYLEDQAALIVTVFLSALLVIMLVGIIIFAARRIIWERLFGYADVQIEQMATPLANIAESAAARDPAAATTAARDFVTLAFARYAWITTRRWIITSLTALIAAMAALAGTALLFKQNLLIETQSGLLKEQNQRIAEQSKLLEQQVQLAEADRNAQVAAGITQIANELAAVVNKSTREYTDADGVARVSLFNAISASDLPPALILRITSTSRAAKPYRFLDLGQRANNFSDRTRIAAGRRRTELPNTYARLEDFYGWTDPGPDLQLIDRPASPERGQLLTLLLSAGLQHFEALNLTGLDLSFAHMLSADIAGMTMQGAILFNSDFTGSSIYNSDLGGAALENSRFVACVIKNSSFADITAERVRDPNKASNGTLYTRANGADFTRAFIENTPFTGAQLTAANFDGAVLLKTDFTNAKLGIATFRGAVLAASTFDGADLKSADFDGAIVFAADPLNDLSRAMEGRFQRDVFQAERIDPAVLNKMPVFFLNTSLEQANLLTNNAPAWRIKRVKPFDDGLPPQAPVTE
jgi:uncharacterized protein YjbI with pentapeptide repeats